MMGDDAESAVMPETFEQRKRRERKDKGERERGGAARVQKTAQATQPVTIIAGYSHSTSLQGRFW